ncbi:MAG TPA: LPD38 domain-containing protein [Sideroxyarcus sp.]|nr:LPD38 domain-containing protein [Sideroxyarcus sp.]
MAFDPSTASPVGGFDPQTATLIDEAGSKPYEPKVDTEKTAAFKESSPIAASLASGTTKLGQTILDTPKFAADVVNEIVVNPFMHLFGKDVGPAKRMEFAQDLEAVSKELTTDLRNKPVEDLGISTPEARAETASWVAQQAAAQSPQMVGGAVASFIPKLRNAYLGFMAATSGADSNVENERRGGDDQRRVIGAVTNGAWEAVGEALPFEAFDKIGGLIKHLPDSEKAAFISDITKKTLAATAAMTAQHASEGIGEMVTQAGQNWTQRDIIGDKRVDIGDGVLTAGAIGAIMATPTSVAHGVQAYRDDHRSVQDLLEKPKATVADIIQSETLDDAIQAASDSISDSIHDTAIQADELLNDEASLEQLAQTSPDTPISAQAAGASSYATTPAEQPAPPFNPATAVELPNEIPPTNQPVQQLDLGGALPAGDMVRPVAAPGPAVEPAAAGTGAVGGELAAATPERTGDTAGADARVPAGAGGVAVAIQTQEAKPVASQTGAVIDDKTASQNADKTISPVVPANNVEAAELPAESTPVFGTNSVGKITLRGMPAEQIKAVRDKLGAKGWIIGKDNAVFPKDANLKTLQAAFGVADESIVAPKKSTAPLTVEERARRAPIMKNAKVLGIKTVARPFSEIEKDVLAAHEAEHTSAVGELSDAEYQQLDDAATELMNKIAGGDEKAQTDLHAAIAELQGKYSSREYYEALTNHLEGLLNDAKPEETGRAESGAGDNQEAGRNDAKPAADQVKLAVKDSLTVQPESSGAQAGNVKPLYASRPVSNAKDIIAWAKSQGFKSTLPASDMHVTVAYSSKPMDGGKVANTSKSINVDGGQRSVEPLGEEGAIVLKFSSDELQSRWKEYRDAGASWDYEGYMPHVTLTYKGDDIDLSKVVPYSGRIELGTEKQESLNTDKQDEYVEVPADKTISAKDTTQSKKLEILKAQAQGKINGDQGAALKELADAGEHAAVDEVLKTPDEALPAAYTMSAHEVVMERVAEGDITADEFKAAFDSLEKNKDGIKAELDALTKPKIFARFPSLEYRYKNEKKDRLIAAAYSDMISDFTLGEAYSYGMGKDSQTSAIRAMVERATDESLATFAEGVKQRRAEREARKESDAAGMENPQTLDDYKRLMRAKADAIGPDATFKQAFMALTPEQRAQYDALAAEQTRGDRKARADQQKTDVRVAAHTTTGDVIETKHTKTGEPLFVVKAAERVERDTYNQWNATAKRLGGWYSSFRGNGAVPGFQFKTRESADAFLSFIGGNAEQAKEVVQARRDAYADDRSQTAVERLTEMADALDERADASLGQERKANTARRARFAASAEAAANSDKALAQTMRNIAEGIQNGTAKLLDRVRQKTQVEMLNGIVTTAQNDMLREKHQSYAEQEKHRGEKPTPEVADYVTFPNYTMFRSDLASLGRALLETEGTKNIGQRLMKVADDVSDAYLKFAKENLHKVSAFKLKDGGMAVLPTKAAAEQSIAASGYHGTAIVLPFKRGENLIILSPSEAIKRGIWEGDNDKRITLSPDFGAEIVEKIGKAERRGARFTAPWQLENAYDKRKRLAAMGIETPAELRAAVREFIGLREAAAKPDKVKQLERSMIGRSNDGLDFFPTPAGAADEMIEAAGIKEGMSILEPSAGMGHIADRIREAGHEPDVVELSGDRRELLDAKGYNVVGHDFMDLSKEDTPNGEGYDRILMNPPFGDRRDAIHVQHAYDLLKPGGRLVSIMGEGVFFGNDSKAQGFRDWLESVGGTDEKLEQGTFLDPSLPVNTGVAARMVVIDKPGVEAPLFSVGGYNVEQTLLDELGSIHKDVDAFLSVNGDVITLSELQMPKEIRGEGLGSQFMEKLTRYADTNGMTIALTAAGDFGGSRSGQERFYKRFGFASNKGRNKDYRISENMIRRPETKISRSVGPDHSGRGLSVSAVESIANPIAEKLKNVRTVKVVARQTEIPSLKEQIDAAFSRFERNKTQENLDKYLAVSKDDIEGAYVNGELYLVASNLKSAERVTEVLRHEVAHLSVEEMLEEVKPGLYNDLLRQVRMLDKAGNKYIRELAAAVDKSQPGLDADTRAAEIIAQIAERGDHETDMPNAVRSLWQRIADGIKAFYKLVFGDTLNDQDVRDIVAQSFRWARGEGDAVRVYGGKEDSSIQASRGTQSPESFARMALEEFAAENDDAFSIPTTNARTVIGAVADVVDGAEYKGEITQEDEKKQSGADRAYLFKSESGDDFIVYETDDKVWINISQYLKGGGGQEVYSAIADYAFNTGKKFIGDPYGLTMDSIIRRTVNMLTSAIKHGTTRHLEPAQQQEWGKPEEGVEPLEWGGSDVDNTKALIHTFVTTMQNLAPQIKEYRYDFQSQQFRDGQGRAVDGQAISDALPRRARAGEKTARRAVFLQSLLSAARESDGGRNGVLELVLRWGKGSTPENLKRLFSRRAESDVDTRDRGSRTGAQRTLEGKIVGNSGRQYTADQIAAMQRTGSVVSKKTVKDTLKQINGDVWKRMAQGIADQFRPVRDIDAHAYTLLRLSKGATGSFEALMQYGKLSIKDGATDADMSGGVLDKVFFPLGKETTDFLRWIAGNRAERLKAVGREHLFTDADIAAFKSLADGTTDFDYTLEDGTVTRDRTKIYADSLKKFNEFNKNVLDIAEQSGLIDRTGRALWEHEFYVPFYRVAEEVGKEGEARGMFIKSGVLRQEAFKKLKGGQEQLNDLLANTLMNWSHLIDASAKNRAATATLEAAEKIGAARKAMPGDSKTSWVMKNGQKVEYKVEDQYLVEALSALEYAGMRGPIMDILTKPKHWLTIGVTASPFFKVRNLVRDSVQAIATADLNYNPAGNVVEGWKLTNRKKPSQEYVSALAGGGLIRFGTMLEGNEASRTRQLIKQGAKDEHILDDESKWRAFYDKAIEPTISAYNELGNRGEEVNRMALYHQLVAKGMSHAEASLAARDLMDFSMQGSWNTVRFLSQLVPFFNARIQGMYKLGRAASEDKARFAIVLGATTLVSLALLAMYGDDDDWKKREDWDRDNYWWFKIGGIAYRIPKPFEIGAMATLAERTAEFVFDDEMTGKRFKDVTTSLVANQLAMNPAPQAFKPMIDLYANKDSFTKRPIEPMGLERVDPSQRYTQGTSLVARGVSAAGNAVTGEGFLSPLQIDFLVQSYFGWMGATSVSAADMLVRSVSDEPTKPAVDHWKLATGGMVADLGSAQSRYVSMMYEQAAELEQTYATFNRLRKERPQDAKEYLNEHREDLRKYKQTEAVKKGIRTLNERIRLIERSNKGAEEKRLIINELRAKQDEISRTLYR